MMKESEQELSAINKHAEKLKFAVMPVIYDLENEEIPYSIKGTCFIALFKRRMYVVTAKHVLGDADPEKVRIPVNLSSGDFIPFNRFYQITPSEDNEDTDFQDIVIFVVSGDPALQQHVNELQAII